MVCAAAAEGDETGEYVQWGAPAPLVQALSIKAAAARTIAARRLRGSRSTETSPSVAVDWDALGWPNHFISARPVLPRSACLLGPNLVHVDGGDHGKVPMDAGDSPSSSAPSPLRGKLPEGQALSLGDHLGLTSTWSYWFRRRGIEFGPRILRVPGPSGIPAGSDLQASPKGTGVPKIIVTAAVNDVEEWLKFKAEMVPAMSAVASDGSSYVAIDRRDQVASTWDVPDMDAFQAASHSLSPELAAAAERAGMIPSTMVTYIKK